MIFILLACSFTVDASSTIKVYNLDTSPVLDALDDWKVVTYTAANLKSVIPGRKKTKILYIKAAVHGDGKARAESKQRLNRGHDDVRFLANSHVRTGISVFEKSGKEDRRLTAASEFIF
ncbi:MAG: hypothetical protein OEY11_14710 [Gammaproteobacteria bacterium]|nr:hypothetical protein [Gammaproteobacteria bacterium]